MIALPGVPPPAAPPAPGAPPPLAATRDFRPYYAPVELDYLVHLQAHTRAPAHPASDHPRAPTTAPLSDLRIQHYRQLACGFIERVGGRLGFPRRTIATAQKLYHRFHLHFSLTDFAYQDVSLSALLVASKLEDTLKKLREIQIAAWQVTNLLEGGNAMGEGDIAAQEAHRPHLIGIERLILQTICFNFNLHRSLDPAGSEAGNDALLLAALAVPPPTRDAFTYLVRLAHSLPSLPSSLLTPPPPAPPPTPAAVLKSLTFAAFLLLADLHRTLAPLSYPPHTCAAACIWLAGFLLAAARGAQGAVWNEEMVREWAERCESEDEDIDDISQTLLDLLIHLCPSPSSSSGASGPLSSATSPLFSPSSASPSESGPLLAGGSKSALSDRDKHLVAAGTPNAFSHPALAGASVDGLTAVKIALRTARPPDEARTRKRLRREEATAEDEALRRSKRWAGLRAGLAEVGRVRDERVARERVRAEERAERALELEGGGVGEGGPDGRTEEERERDRRERRERLKPGSVRYRF